MSENVRDRIDAAKKALIKEIKRSSFYLSAKDDIVCEALGEFDLQDNEEARRELWTLINRDREDANKTYEQGRIDGAIDVINEALEAFSNLSKKFSNLSKKDNGNS